MVGLKVEKMAEKSVDVLVGSWVEMMDNLKVVLKVDKRVEKLGKLLVERTAEKTVVPTVGVLAKLLGQPMVFEWVANLVAMKADWMVEVKAD